MRIAVIDGQGGGIGKHITEKLRKTLPPEAEIIALGTNAMATSVMLKAGANEGASGENAVIQNVAKVDIVAGSLAIILPHSMLGELTPRMAEAISKSTAKKLLLSINKSGVEIIGVKGEPLPHQIEELVKKIKLIMEGEKDV